MLSLFYPIFHANRLLARIRCTLLGDETVEELDRPKELIFRDTELYSAEKRTEVTVIKNENAKQDLRLAGILFRKLGGTLAPIGASCPDAEADPAISILRIAESGVEAVIDNRHHMLAGDAHFLARNGVSVPKESTDKTLRRTSEVSLMYVAINGVLKISYEIEYEAKASFERMVCDLAEIDCAAAISSLDPNLDDVFLQKSRFSASDPISVIKPNHFEDDTPLEMADVGVVSLDGEEKLIHPLFAANGISRVKRFAFRIQLIASILAGGLTLLLSLLGQTDLLGIPDPGISDALWRDSPDRHARRGQCRLPATEPKILTTTFLPSGRKHQKRNDLWLPKTIPQSSNRFPSPADTRAVNTDRSSRINLP